MNLKLPQELDWRPRVFDSLSFPTLIMDCKGTVVSVNQKLLEKYHILKSQVVGKSCKEIFRNLFDDPDLPCHQETCPLDKTIAEGVGHSVLRQIERRNGSKYWEDRVFSPILDDAGNVIYVIESIRDVTRTKALENILHDIRVFMNRLVQSSASAILSADRSGRILLMNEAAEELFGYDFDNTANISVVDLYPEGVAREIMKKLRDDDYGGRGKLPATHVNILTARGETVPVEMTGAIIYEGENTETATMGIYNDIRERLALQDAQSQLDQSEKMASLGRLAAGVAHEINNPLTGILMYGNLMKEKMEPDHPLQTNISYILEDAERCREIVKNLLAYSRQSGTSQERFSMNVMVEESLRLIRDQSLFMNLTTKKEFSDECMMVKADRNKMCQVVINLVINAIDAMDPNGTLTLKTYRSNDQKRACLEITDTGFGIPDEDRLRIFDPFFTTKDPGKGTGLGLSTAYGIIKDNKGDIIIKETGHEGTTFLVELPLDTDSIELMSIG